MKDREKQIEEMEKFIIKTRNILKNTLLINSRPIKSTSKKDCYSCLMNLQELYKSNNSISDKDFLKTLFKTEFPEDSKGINKETIENTIEKIKQFLSSVETVRNNDENNLQPEIGYKCSEVDDFLDELEKEEVK